MAMSKSDRWLIAALAAVFIFGIAVLTAGFLIYRAVSGIYASPETEAESPPLEWEKTFRRGAMSRGVRVELTSDGGLIMAARVWDGEIGGNRGDDWTQKIHLLKTGADGSLAWEALFDGGGWCYPVAVEEAAGGGFFVLGNTAGDETFLPEPDMYGPEAAPPGAALSDGSIVVIKTDAQGKLEWEKDIGNGNHYRASTGRETADGGYIVFGAIKKAVADVGLFLAKIDSTGREEWERHFAPWPDTADCPVEITDREGYFLEPAANGGYICTGLHLDEMKFFAFETDESGNILRKRSITPEIGSAILYAAAPSPDGGLVLAASTRSGFLSSFFNPSLRLIKIDASGNLEWEQHYRRSGTPWSIIPLDDGGCFVLNTSFIFYPVPGSQLILLRTGPSGELIWMKTFTPDENNPSGYFPGQASPTADGGVVLTGSLDDHLFLLKVMPENRQGVET